MRLCYKSILLYIRYMSFTVSKQDGKLVFNDNGGYENRNPSTFWCIKGADDVYKWDDFSPIQIYTNDYQMNNEYSYSSGSSYATTVPDFNFHCWKEAGIDDYGETIKLVDE